MAVKKKCVNHNLLKFVNHNSLKFVNHNSLKFVNHNSLKFVNHNSIKCVNPNSLKFVNHNSLKCVNHNSLKFVNHNSLKFVSVRLMIGGWFSPVSMPTTMNWPSRYNWNVLMKVVYNTHNKTGWVHVNKSTIFIYTCTGILKHKGVRITS